MGVQEAEFDGDLWFFTKRDSRKFDELKADARVNLSFCDLKENNFVSLTGLASFVEDRNKMKQLWKPILRTWFPEGPEDPDLALFNVRCDEAEYWDGPSGLGMVLALAKSYVTGNDSALGENDRVRL
jgi:general stress protein 26